MDLATIPNYDKEADPKKETPKAEAKEVKINGDAIDDNAMASLLGL